MMMMMMMMVEIVTELCDGSTHISMEVTAVWSVEAGSMMDVCVFSKPSAQNIVICKKFYELAIPRYHGPPSVCVYTLVVLGPPGLQIIYRW